MKHIVINIGRQFGSGGLAVARELGRKLNIPVYDVELINKAAQDSGFSENLFKENDETRHFFSLKTVFSGPFGRDYTSENELFKIQSETIKQIAEQGSAIFVGRCSDYILRDKEFILNVFLTAPIEERIKRVCERGESCPEKALSFIEKKDKERENYYNYYTFGNWGVASTYNLCMDSSILGIEGTADFIIDFAKKSGKL